jgi:hypothetical protein
MPHRVDADLNIQRFGFAIDDNATRLMFPTAAMNALAGNAGGFQYPASCCTMLLGALRLKSAELNFRAVSC